MQSRLFSMAAGCAVRGARQVSVSDIHCTLVFIGDVEFSVTEELKIGAATIDLPVFSLCIDHIDWWRGPQVLWAGVGDVPESLLQLHAQLRDLARETGIHTDPRPLVPHLTLWRKVREPVPKTAIAPVRWEVRAFAIVESVGNNSAVRYRVLQNWPLRATW